MGGIGEQDVGLHAGGMKQGGLEGGRGDWCRRGRVGDYWKRMYVSLRCSMQLPWIVERH